MKKSMAVLSVVVLSFTCTPGGARAEFSNSNCTYQYKLNVFDESGQPVENAVFDVAVQLDKNEAFFSGEFLGAVDPADARWGKKMPIVGGFVESSRNLDKLGPKANSLDYAETYFMTARGYHWRVDGGAGRETELWTAVLAISAGYSNLVNLASELQRLSDDGLDEAINLANYKLDWGGGIRPPEDQFYEGLKALQEQGPSAEEQHYLSKYKKLVDKYHEKRLKFVDEFGRGSAESRSAYLQYKAAAADLKTTLYNPHPMYFVDIFDKNLGTKKDAASRAVNEYAEQVTGVLPSRELRVRTNKQGSASVDLLTNAFNVPEIKPDGSRVCPLRNEVVWRQVSAPDGVPLLERPVVTSGGVNPEPLREPYSLDWVRFESSATLRPKPDPSSSPGPSPTRPGPGPTTPGPSPTRPAPEPTTPGPSPTRPGPGPTTPGPSPTIPGPEPTTPGPSSGPNRPDPSPVVPGPGPGPGGPGSAADGGGAVDVKTGFDQVVSQPGAWWGAAGLAVLGVAAGAGALIMRRRDGHR